MQDNEGRYAFSRTSGIFLCYLMYVVCVFHGCDGIQPWMTRFVDGITENYAIRALHPAKTPFKTPGVVSILPRRNMLNLEVGVCEFLVGFAIRNTSSS